MEFAKRTIYRGVDVSPIALKEVSASMQLLPALVQFGRKYNLSLPQLLRGFGFGWRVLSWLSKPLGKLSGPIRAIILAVAIPSTAEEIKAFFQLGAPKFVKYVNSQRNIAIDFIEYELRVARLKLEKRLAFAKDFRFNFAPEYLPKLWLKHLLESEEELLSTKLEQATSVSDELGLNSPANDKAVKSKIAKLTKQLKDLKDLPKNSQKYIEFFYEVYRHVINPALANYMVTCMETLAKFPNWANSFKLIMSNRDSLDFVSQYALYIEFLHDLSLLGEHIFKFEKPEGSEAESRSLNAVTPAQIRFFRKWSGVLQGSVPINELKLKVYKIKSKSLLSSRLDEMEE
jgi:hypothetical protein